MIENAFLQHWSFYSLNYANFALNKNLKNNVLITVVINMQ